MMHNWMRRHRDHSVRNALRKRTRRLLTEISFLFFFCRQQHVSFSFFWSTPHADMKAVVHELWRRGRHTFREKYLRFWRTHSSTVPNSGHVLVFHPRRDERTLSGFASARGFREIGRGRCREGNVVAARNAVMMLAMEGRWKGTAEWVCGKYKGHASDFLLAHFISSGRGVPSRRCADAYGVPWCHRRLMNRCDKTNARTFPIVLLFTAFLFFVVFFLVQPAPRVHIFKKVMELRFKHGLIPMNNYATSHGFLMHGVIGTCLMVSTLCKQSMLANNTKLWGLLVKWLNSLNGPCVWC